MDSCVFTNDNNVVIQMLNHSFSPVFRKRDNHEVQFRRINTYLINNKVIKNNIIDLGAWIGDNSIPWAKNIDGTIYAIDPSHDNCDYINQMCMLNEIENIKILQYAISNINECLSTNEHINHCSFVYGNPGVNGRTKLNAVSLDYLFSEKIIESIGYIHLDVEGMEYKVIQGAESIIEKYKPIITFEQHLNLDDYNVILSYLAGKGYKVFLIDEVLPGCRLDCRNSIAFPNEVYSDELINGIHSYLGKELLISKN